jgi:hypothetical protein
MGQHGRRDAGVIDAQEERLPPHGAGGKCREARQEKEQELKPRPRPAGTPQERFEIDFGGVAWLRHRAGDRRILDRLRFC